MECYYSGRSNAFVPLTPLARVILFHSLLNSSHDVVCDKAG